MSDDDIEIGVEHSAEDDERSSSPDTSGTDRTSVYVKGEFGTELLKPDENDTCRSCKSSSVGIMKMTVSGIATGVPLCVEHKEKVERVAEYAHKDVDVVWTEWDSDE